VAPRRHCRDPPAGAGGSVTASPRVRLATSRYRNYQYILASGFVPVRTSLGAPRFKLPYQLSTRLPSITPTRILLAIREPDEFAMAYRLQLEEIGVEAIGHGIGSISSAHDGRPLVLLCYEDLAQTGPESCHRRMFAEWWERKTGQEVPEFPTRSSESAEATA